MLLYPLDDVFYCFAALKNNAEQSLPLEYTIDVFNNHSAYQFYLIS
jgi:hypothetical protein